MLYSTTQQAQTLVLLTIVSVAFSAAGDLSDYEVLRVPDVNPALAASPVKQWLDKILKINGAKLSESAKTLTANAAPVLAEPTKLEKSKRTLLEFARRQTNPPLAFQPLSNVQEQDYRRTPAGVMPVRSSSTTAANGATKPSVVGQGSTSRTVNSGNSNPNLAGTGTNGKHTPALPANRPAGSSVPPALTGSQTTTTTTTPPPVTVGSNPPVKGQPVSRRAINLD